MVVLLNFQPMGWPASNSWARNIMAFDLNRFASSRPSDYYHVFDKASLIKYSKENIESSLEYFKTKYGVEIVVATIPELQGQDTVAAASMLFRNWHVGRANKGNGILVLICAREKLIKVKVEGSPAIKQVFTDSFCGYIERKQLRPYLENNELGVGLTATLKEFFARADGRLTDEEIQKRMEE